MLKPSEKWGPGEAKFRQDWLEKNRIHEDYHQDSKKEIEEFHLPNVNLSGGTTNSAFQIN